MSLMLRWSLGRTVHPLQGILVAIQWHKAFAKRALLYVFRQEMQKIVTDPWRFITYRANWRRDNMRIIFYISDIFHIGWDICIYGNTRTTWRRDMPKFSYSFWRKYGLRQNHLQAHTLGSPQKSNTEIYSGIFLFQREFSYQSQET